MIESARVKDAMQRLDAAMASLETALGGRLEQAGESEKMQEEVHRIGLDRSRLAQSLDAAEARSAGLEETNREVSRRLDAAMDTIRGVLERQGD